jgi:peptide/nickel transport system substrate-binding protein
MHARTMLTKIAAALSLTLLLSACGSVKPTATGPKSMTIAMWSAPAGFLPITESESYGAFVISLIYPHLVAMNDKQEYVPSLAASFDVNPEQNVYTFKLRPDAKWTDGQPITAEDVAYTYQVIANPATPTTKHGYIDIIKGLDKDGISETKDFGVSGIKVLDPQTIQFTTKTPVARDLFLEKVASNIYIVPKHVLTTVTNLKDLQKADFVLKPTVFGGPFRIVDYKTDTYVELAPNPDYFLGKPKLDKLFVKIVGQASLAAALEKGEVDVTAGTGMGEVPLVDWEKTAALPNIRPVAYSALYAQHLDFNVALPEFKDPKVREAFAHAINRPLMVQRLLKGQGDVINTTVTPANKYYVPELQSGLEYNPDKAKQMLQAANWDFDKEVVILTPTGNTAREQAADMIQGNLQAVGVKAKIEKVDFPTRQARSKKGDFELSLIGQGTGFDPDIYGLVGTNGASNDRKYSNPALDEAVQKGKLTADPTQKRQYYTEAQKIWVQDVPMLPLFTPKVLQAVNKRLVNVNPGIQGIAWNAQDWDVK